jgi:hypothetical protein
MAIVKLNQGVPNAWLVERLQIACREPIQNAAFPRDVALFDLVQPSSLVGNILLEFRVDRVHFSFCGRLCEKWFFEELAENV